MGKIGLRVIKTAIGAAVAIIIAELFGLKFPYTAAIITLLSTQSTRKRSFDVIWQRVKATVLSLSIGSIVFPLLGFHPPAFAVYLLFFIPLAVGASASEGISTSAVLATHLLGEGAITWTLLQNEAALMAIGTGVSILANLYMPKILPKIAEDQELIEENFLEILLHLLEKIYGISTTAGELFEKTEKLLEVAKRRAEKSQGNYVFQEVSYFAQYMEMRFLQFEKLRHLEQILDTLALNAAQAGGLAALTEMFTEHLHDLAHIEEIIANAQSAIEDFKNHPLPKTREEFYNETQIFSYLKEFLHLLEITQNFTQHLSAEEKSLAQELIARESPRYKKQVRFTKEMQCFSKNLDECYRKQLPTASPQVKELQERWNTLQCNFEKNGHLEEIQELMKNQDHPAVYDYLKKALDAKASG
ncbi:MAG: aromatic acid exporter family protein [Turicibacter sp.]|nr:aromatic acid exporter family protein [Turicibacter sp.]